MFIYLASPYTHKDKAVVNQRFYDTEATTAFFIQKGLTIYSPIIHSHDITKKYSLPTDADFWYTYNMRFLTVAKEMWVLKLDGWSESKGVKMELDYCRIHFKPIIYIEPDQLSRYI